MPPTDNVCLLVRRGRVTDVFPLRSKTVRFGYAPGDENDLVLYDSLLNDVHGEIELRASTESVNGLTRYSAQGVQYRH